jgi:hypothetical protein
MQLEKKQLTLVARSLLEKYWQLFKANAGKILLSFLLPTVLLVATLIFFIPVWRVNDNSAIAQVAAEGYIVRFINIILARAVHLAHTYLSADVAWFALIIYVCLFMSMVLSLYTFLQMEEFLSAQRDTLTRVIVFLFLAVWVVLYAPFFLRPDFTAAALLLGVSALVFGTSRWVARGYHHRDVIIAASMLTLATMVRVAAFQGILLISLPFIGLVLFARGFTVEPNRRVTSVLRGLVVVAMMLGPAWLIHTGDELYKEHFAPPAYQTYHDFMEVRGPLHITVRYTADITVDDITTIVHGTEFTPEDIDWFAGFTFFDENRYNTDSLTRLAEQYPPSYMVFTHTDTLLELGEEIFQDYQHIAVIMGGVLLFASAKALHSQPVKHTLLYTVLPAVGVGFSFWLVIAVTAATRKFEERIGDPFFLAALGVLWVTLRYIQPHLVRLLDIPQVKPHHKRTTLTTLMQLAAGGVLVFSLQASMAEYTDAVEEANELVERITTMEANLQAALTPEAVYATMPGTYATLPLTSSELDANRLPLGWQTFSPRFHTMLEEKLAVHNGSELIPAFVDNPNAYLVGSRWWVCNTLDFADVDAAPAFVSEVLLGEYATINAYRIVPDLEPTNNTCELFTLPPFNRISSTEIAWVESFFQTDITQGCGGDETYCFEKPVTRGELAVFLLRAMNYPDSYTPQGTPEQIFADVPGSSQPAVMETWIEDFHRLGIIPACQQGSDSVGLQFCPERLVTRGEAAVYILRALEGKNYMPQGDPEQIFVDVPGSGERGSPQAFIEEFYTRGITTGCNRGTPRVDLEFCPDQPLTRGAMAVFFLRAFDHIPDESP